MKNMRNENMKKYHDTRFNRNPKILQQFQVGDSVLVLQPREKRVKLSLHYSGPFMVKKVLPQTGKNKSNMYVLTDEEGNECIKPASDLKKYMEPIFETNEELPVEHPTSEVLEEELAKGAVPKHREEWVRKDLEEKELLEPEVFDKLFGEDIEVTATRVRRPLNQEGERPPPPAPRPPPPPIVIQPPMEHPMANAQVQPNPDVRPREPVGEQQPIDDRYLRPASAGPDHLSDESPPNELWEASSDETIPAVHDEPNPPGIQPPQ